MGAPFFIIEAFHEKGSHHLSTCGHPLRGENEVVDEGRLITFEWGKVKGLAPRETYLEIRPGDHPIGLDHRKSPLMLPVVSVYRRRSS